MEGLDSGQTSNGTSLAWRKGRFKIDDDDVRPSSSTEPNFGKPIIILYCDTD